MKIGLVLLASILVVTGGCSCTPGEYGRAEQVCKHNGGVEVIWIVGWELTADCKNGASFDIPKVSLGRE